MTDCIFCKIINKELPSTILYEDEDTLAFLDINPGAEGHTLVIPKKHYERLTDADEKSRSAVFTTVAKVSKALQKTLGSSGIGLFQNDGAAAGQVVMHMHVHVVPREENDDFRFNRLHPLPEELQATAEKIKGAL